MRSLYDHTSFHLPVANTCESILICLVTKSTCFISPYSLRATGGVHIFIIGLRVLPDLIQMEWVIVSHSRVFHNGRGDNTILF